MTLGDWIANVGDALIALRWVFVGGYALGLVAFVLATAMGVEDDVHNKYTSSQDSEYEAWQRRQQLFQTPQGKGGADL